MRKAGRAVAAHRLSYDSNQSLPISQGKYGRGVGISARGTGHGPDRPACELPADSSAPAHFSENPRARIGVRHIRDPSRRSEEKCWCRGSEGNSSTKPVLSRGKSMQIAATPDADGTLTEKRRHTRVDCAPQSFSERDGGLIAQNLTNLVQTGERVAYITCSRRLEVGLDICRKDRLQGSD